MALRIDTFSGIAPRFNRRNLGQNNAQVAENCRLTGGGITPFYGLKERDILTGTGTHKTVHRMNDGATDFWLAWTGDVDVARGPIAGDTTQRLYFTSDEFEPRATNLAMATSAPPYPAAAHVLGVFPPATAPTVGHSSGSGSAEDRAYCYTFVTPWGEESQPSPASGIVSGTVGGTWTISNMDAAPPNSGTVTAAVKDTPAVGQVQVTLNSVFGLRAKEQVAFASVAGMTDLNGTHRLVSVDTATNKVVVALATTQTYTSGGTWARAATHNTTGMVKRIYRTVTTASGTEFQYVKEVSAATTSTTDGVATPAEVVPSADWDMPAADMRGIIALPNGIMAGFVGNELCLCEPYKPYAWPEKYRLATDYEIVGIGVFGSSVVVATSGSPYLATGIDPEAFSMERVDQAWPCLSKRGVVSMGFGVGFPCPHGLSIIGTTGAILATEPFYTQAEWQEINPATFVGAHHDGRYMAVYDVDAINRKMIVLDRSETLAALLEVNVNATAVFSDPETGRLYLVVDNVVHEWDADQGVKMLFDWQSKEFVLPNPANLGAAQVHGDFSMSPAEQVAAEAAYNAALSGNQALIDGYACDGDLGEFFIGQFPVGGDAMTDIPPLSFDSLQFSLYVDNELAFNKKVANSRAFRLPAGYKSDVVAVRVSGNVRVFSVTLGETMLDLKAA